LPIIYSTPTADDLAEINEVDGRAFGYPTTPESLAASAEVLELDRFVIARDNDTMVACGGAFSLELTLPGPAIVPMAGVTWVAVATSHRRLGIAREIMGRLDDDARRRNEPIIGLTASEGGIYERFGYGPATSVRTVSLDRRRVQLAAGHKPEPGSIKLVDHTSHLAELADIYDRFRRRRTGESSRPAAMFKDGIRPDKSNRQIAGLHQDGYAIWNIEQDWNEGDPQHRVRVWELIALTEEAYLALWDTVLSIDLAGEISSRFAAAPDEPLPYFLTDPRALKTTHLGDHLWLKVLDPERAFSARQYRTDDRFVLELNNGRLLQVDGDGARLIDNVDADLRVTESALGPLVLGGVAPSTLAAGRRLSGRADVLSRADAFFEVRPLPHCRTSF